jgi:hypothetical protein
MATNDFLPFAVGSGANVLSQSAYAALTAISNGYSAGIAQSAALNKTWRQSSIMAAVLAQFISDRTGSNAVDDGTTATLLANLKAALPAAHGQCRLSVSSTTTLLLSPYNGNSVIVNGIPLQLPTAGVTYTASGLSASTKYYVYLGGTTATPALSLSTTGYVTASNGVVVMNGDATKTLVGMVYTTASTQFVDAIATRFCLNWFNRRKIVATNAIAGPFSFTNTASAELTSSARTQFLAWSDDVPIATWSSYGTETSGTPSATTLNFQLYMDGSTPYGPGNGVVLQPSWNQIVTQTGALGGLSEGYHYSTLLTNVGTNGGTLAVNNIQNTVNIFG